MIHNNDYGRVGFSIVKEAVEIANQSEEFAPDQPVDFAALARIGKKQAAPELKARPSHKATQPIMPKKVNI